LTRRKWDSAPPASEPCGPILYSEHFEEDGRAMFVRACAMKLERIVCKQRDAPYRSGRGESWLKVKCAKRAEFPIRRLCREARCKAAPDCLALCRTA
jgi:ATP-dependent DNA ligase